MIGNRQQKPLLIYICASLTFLSLTASQGLLQLNQNVHLFAPPDGKLFLFSNDFFDASQKLSGLDYSYPSQNPTISVTQANFQFNMNNFTSSFTSAIDPASQGLVISSQSVKNVTNMTFTYQCTESSTPLASTLASTSSVNITQIKYLVQWSSDKTTQAPVMTPTLQNFQIMLVKIQDDVACKPNVTDFSIYLSQKLEEKIKQQWSTIVPTFVGKNFNQQYKWKIKNTTLGRYDYYTMDLTFSNVMAPIIDSMPVSYNYLYSVSWSSSNRQNQSINEFNEIHESKSKITKSSFNGAPDDCVVIPSDLLWNITSQVFLNRMQTTLTVDSSNAPFTLKTFPAPALQIRHLILLSPQFDITNYTPTDPIKFVCQFTYFDRTFNSFKYNVSFSCNIQHNSDVLWVTNFDLLGDFIFRAIRKEDSCNGKYAIETLMVYPDLILKADDKSTQVNVNKSVIQRWEAYIIQSFLTQFMYDGNVQTNYMTSCWDFLVELNRDGVDTATLKVDSSGVTVCYDVDYSPLTKDLYF